MPRGRVSTTGSVVEVQHQDAAAATAVHRAIELMEDPVFVTRLKSKITQSLCDVGPNGTVTLTDIFHKLDRKFCSGRQENAHSSSPAYALDIWAFKRLFSSIGLNDIELEVLFALFLDEADREAAFAVSDSASVVHSSSGRTQQSVSAYQRHHHQALQASSGPPPTVDAAEVMLALRKMCYTISIQFHEIIKRARSRRINPTALDKDGHPLCEFYLAYTRDGVTAKRREVFQFLVSVLRMTDSEAFLCLEYFALAGSTGGKLLPEQSSPGSRSDSVYTESSDGAAAPAALDMNYLIAVLFEHPLPDDIAFPLLMSKLVEAVTNPNRGEESGLTTILEQILLRCDVLDARGRVRDVGRKGPIGLDELRALETSWGGAEDRDDKRAAADDAGPTTPIPYSLALRSRWIDLPLFRRLCTCVNSGLPSAEVELLYSYLAEQDSALLNASTLVEQLLLRLPRVPPTDLFRAAAAIRQQIVSNGKGAHALNELHSRLSVYGDHPIPPLSFCGVLRSLGVQPHVVPTVLIDAVRQVAPRCAQTVTFIRGPLPPARLDVLQKLYVLFLEDAGLSLMRRPQPNVVQDKPASPLETRRLSMSRSFHSPPPPPQESSEGATIDMAEQLAISVPVHVVLSRFEPEQAGGLVTSGDAHEWHKQFQRFLEAASRPIDADVARRLHEESPCRSTHPLQSAVVTFDDILYFWGNVSAAISEDSQFTLMLWKSFSMHRAVSRSQQQRRYIDNAATTPSRYGPSSVPQRSQDPRERRLLRD